MAYIPTGSFLFYKEHYSYSITKTNKKISADSLNQLTLNSFYISKYEVTNNQYLEFIADIKTTDSILYKKMLPDTLVWRNSGSLNEPYVEYYFRHPAYSNYPVVGITHQQAHFFCEWLTKKYMADPKRKYKNVVFKLPTHEQWEYAANGGLEFSVLPWRGDAYQNKKGEWLANFAKINQCAVKDSVYVKKKDGTLKKQEYYLSGKTYNYYDDPHDSFFINNADVTAPVNSYFPNNYGIYNLAGNVEELINEYGITKGGSWDDTGYYLQNRVYEKYDTLNEASATRGFRFVMEIIK